MSAGVETLLPQPVLDPVTPATAVNSINPVDGPFLRFPPFPLPPPEVTIMPFKDFKERGIAMEPGPDDAEVDTLGIPTIPLLHPHTTDVCKTNTKRKRKAEENKARKKGGAGSKNIPWYEEWEEAEVARFSTGFNPLSSRFERIQAAAIDFTSGRKWPLNYASETGPRYIFDKFLRYIGVPTSGPVPGEKKSKKAEEELSDDGMDDEEEQEGASVEPNVQEDSMAGIIMDREIPAKLQLSSNEEKLISFFNNPEKSIKIFLSSHARFEGFIWSDANLDCIGRIMDFFVRFILRSKVLPESERSLRRSLEVIEVAKKELPNTSALAKAFPDIFSRASSACWGWKAEGYTVLSLEDKDIPAESMKSMVEEVKEDEPVEQTSAWGSQPSWGSSADSTWASSTADGDGWGVSVIPESIPEPSPWEVVKEDNLLSLLGPTALPLTHTTGIVEQSMRRIKAIMPLPQNPPKPPPQPEGVCEPDAAAVELDLDCHFFKVVLEPMPVNWDGGDILAFSNPKILNTSRGAVADPNAAEPAPKAHDPFKDDVTLLMEAKSETVALLSVGMGLGGTWVQIAREGEPVKKKKKGKSKSKPVTYWYLDGLSVVTPSFWTVKS
ncbi:hypothetical protein CPB84DRAFT_1759175 [Gymnopilus junonius]|uniref:Uncharacterized protein n=1 Tax=Gymnopilus junonius TaxID=109634 RepID=A0A9P5P3S4_GYMJU|nr:hypothetical protein CPB84DRAFT_1759175 [Gymnopilus junonius]